MTSAGAADHFAHSPDAERNRQVKAARLAEAAVGFGAHLDALDGRQQRHAVERRAGLTRPASDETWQLALQLAAAQVRVVCRRCRCPFDGVTAEAAQAAYTAHVPLAHPKARAGWECQLCAPPRGGEGFGSVAAAGLAADAHYRHAHYRAAA